MNSLDGRDHRREKSGVLGIVIRMGGHRRRHSNCPTKVELHRTLQRAIQHSLGHHHVALVSYHDWRAPQTRNPSRDECVGRRRMDVERVVLCHQSGYCPWEGGHQHRSAQPSGYGQPNHAHATDRLLARQVRLVLGGQNRELVAPLRKAFGDSLGVHRQTGPVRCIEVEGRENPHDITITITITTRLGRAAVGGY